MTKASEQYRAALAEAKPKRSKYGNRKTVVDGIEFDSAKEANRYQELLLLERAGAISHLERQPRFDFVVRGNPVKYDSGRQAYYKADFAYFDGERRIVEDAKGFRTKEYKLKKAFVEAVFPAVKIVEV
jgi:hypothetical protein